MKRIVFSLLILFCVCLCLNSSANSAPSSWYGGDSSGVICKEEDCPLEVLEEKLIFTIDSLSFSIIDDNKNSNTVSAEYTFYNPKEFDVSANLVFPLGKIPSYIYDMNYRFDISKYDISVNGEGIDKTIRHTLCRNFDFDIYENIKLIRDDYEEDRVYKRDLPVHKIRISASEMPENNQYYTLAYTTTKDRVKPIGGISAMILEENQVTYTFLIKNNEEIDLYILGEMDENFSQNLKVYASQALQRDIYAKLDYKILDTKPLEEYIFLNFKEDYNISRIDWFNAVIDKLNFKDYFQIYDFDVSQELLLWFEYGIQVGTKSTIKNKVIAPLYPDIHLAYQPPIFDFTYLLSPAGKWAAFKNLNIEIITEYYILNTSIGNFKKTDDGYKLHFDQLPKGELFFSASTDSNPNLNKEINIFTIIALVILIFIFIFVVGCILLIILLKTKNNKGDIALKRVRRILVLELILGSFMAIFGFLGIFFDIFSILGVIISLILLTLFLIEKFKYKQNSIGRLVIYIFSALFMILSFVDSNSNESLENLGVTSLVFGIVFIIILFFKLGLLNKTYTSEKKEIINIPLPGVKNKYYPIGYLSFKWCIILWVGLSIWIVSFLITFLLIVLKSSMMSLWVILGFFVLLIVYAFLFGLCMGLSNEKEFRQFFKDLDYTKLEKTILEKLKDEKIHPETTNYYIMRLSVYAAVFDMERYNALEKDIFIPENKMYRLQYEMKKINYSSSEIEMMNELDHLLELYPKQTSIRNTVNKLRNLANAYFHGRCIGAIDNIAPYKTKNEYLNGLHLFIQINYYEKRNNLEKSKELRDLFFKKYSKMKVLINLLNGNDISKEETQMYLVARFCPVCGTEHLLTDAYCTKCGTKLKKEEEKL